MYIPRGILCLHLLLVCETRCQGVLLCHLGAVGILGEQKMLVGSTWGRREGYWEKLLAWQHLGKHYQTSLSCEMASPGAEGEAGWLWGGSDVVFWVYFATLRGDGSVTPQELTR